MVRACLASSGSRGGLCDRVLLVALLASAVLHAGTLYAANRWGDCICNIGKVVCPKMGQDCRPSVNLELVEKQMPKPPPPPPPPPKPKPEPVVTVEEPKPDRPPAAPKAGRVVLPDEAFEQAPGPDAEIKLDRPSLSEDVVVKESEAEAPVIVSGEIFGRADELVPGEPGVFGLGGTGTGVGLGPFGTEEEGGGTGTGEAPAPVAPVPEPPAPRPKGPSQDPRVINWTDPPYPEQARQQGIEGTVILKLTITAEGGPCNVAVVRSSGHSALDEAAVAHVKKTKFSPALKHGDPVAVTITFRVKFRLVNA